MKSISLHKGYSMRTSWMITYISVLILALTSGLLCYGFLSSQLREQLAERNDVVLSSIQETIDGQLRIIDNSTFNIAVDKEVQDIINTVELPLDQNDKYKIYNFVSDLQYMKGWGNVENYADSIMIYFPHIDLIMKQNTSHDSKSFYEVYLSAGQMSFEDWKQFIKGRHDGAYRIMDFYGEQNELFYIKTVFPSTDKSEFINIIFKINKYQMLEMNRKLSLQDYGFFAVLSDNGQIMMQIEPAENEFNAFDDIQKLLNDENVCVFKKISEFNNWQYIYILPKHIAYKTINDSRLIMIFIVSVSLIMGLLLILYFTNLHYKPIRKMLSFFPTEEKGKRDNEYSFLENQISTVLNKSAEIRKTADRQYSLLRDYLLNAVLTGQKLTEGKSRIEFDYLNFNPETGDFITFVIFAGMENPDANMQKEQSYRHFLICNIMNELLTNLGYVFHSMEKDDTVVYITEIPEGINTDKLLEAVDFAFDIIRSEFGFEFYCGFGNEHSGQRGISESYNEAKSVLEYCLSAGKTGRMTYLSVEDKLSKSHFYSLEQENKLLNLLKTNEQAKLRQEIHGIFRINIQNNTFSISAVRYLVMDLFNTVKKALIQSGRMADKEFPEEIKFIDNIFNEHNIEQMERTIQNIFCSCATKLVGENSSEDVIESVISYIKENYNNQNLSITMIADKFSMNHDYISRKFKETTGMRIGDYISNIRVEKSKELLCDFNNLISNIAETVGFSSYRTYVRVFTNVTGVTPKKFRDMQQG